MKKKYVLFDFDGVIADTEESNSHYLGLALKEFGVEGKRQAEVDRYA